MIRLSTDVLNTVLHLGVASRLDLDKPVGVVIDALDETDRARLKDTATTFSHLFRCLADYRNVKVFILSRTEDDIRNPFAWHMKDSHVKHIHLDTARPVFDRRRGHFPEAKCGADRGNERSELDGMAWREANGYSGCSRVWTIHMGLYSRKISSGADRQVGDGMPK